MSVHDLVLVAEKRPWVPEWLFVIAKHWTPAASLLCRPVSCAYRGNRGCAGDATAWVEVQAMVDGRDHLPMCDFCYSIEVALRRGHITRRNP